MAGCCAPDFPMHFDSISDEILLAVLRLLKIDDVLRVSCVCKRFNRLAHDQTLHRNVHFGGAGNNLYLSTKVLQSYITKHAAWIESCILLDCYWISAYKIANILKGCQNLHELNIIGCKKISLSDLALLAGRNPKLRKLGVSVPSKIYGFKLYEPNGDATELNAQLCEFFGRLSSLKLRFEILSNFKTMISLFPKQMKLLEFSLEYNGPKPTSIIHDGSDYYIYIRSKVPFSMYFDEKLHMHGNTSLYFNVLFMNFATKIARNATETKEIDCLLAPGSSNIVAMNLIASYKTPLISMIDLSSTYLTPEKINWLGHLTHLTHLNLQHVGGFKANLMKVIATNCPNLDTLNLNSCTEWVDEDLCALKALCLSCLRLRHLNVGQICWHSSPKLCDDKIYTIIAQMKQLRSLSIAPCCLVKSLSTGSGNTTYTLSKSTGKQSNLIGKEEINPTLSLVPQSTLDTASASSTRLVSPGYTTRYAAQQRNLEAKVIENGSGLDDLVNSLRDLEKFELIAAGYSSVFSVPLNRKLDSFVCPITRTVLDASLLPLRNWRKLRSLTLAGLYGVGAFNSLIEITKCCTNLEQLSLASIGLPGNAMALAALPEALKHCHRLRKLRLDQPHFSRIERLMTSLQQNCRRIEAVLVACRNGRIPRDIQNYFDLFDACKRLCIFQLFSGATGVLGKSLSKKLTKRYHKERPPLSINILHFNQSLTQHGLDAIPFSNIQTLTCFQSTVALSGTG